MNKILASTFMLLAIFSSATALAFEIKSPQTLMITKPVHLHQTSLVGNNSLMTEGGGAHPIFRLEKAVVPVGWEMKYMGEYYASLTIRWNKGDKWTTVLDRFAKLHNVNAIIDGGKKTVLIGPAGVVRHSGTILTSSLSPVAEKRYQLSEAYAAVQQANHTRLMQIAEKEKRKKIRQLTRQNRTKLKATDDNVEVVALQRADPINDVVKKDKALIENPDQVEKKPEEYTLTLNRGALKEQIVNYIADFENVKQLDFATPTKTIWLADRNIQWPNEFTVKGKSELHVLNDILKSYNLYARIKKNNIVVISEGK